ncbi:MAG: hypothetical protein O2854_04435, partial [Chloroflexi bacterium]|nr:hypothetical protein [Chloroflexota bacterium]
MATQNGKKLQLFIFEEQQILRDAYVAALESHDRIRVVGSSGDTGHEAIAAALKLHNPAVILL